MSHAQVRAEAAFRARLAELGATLLEPYKGSGHPHRVRCAAGDECSPRPDNIKQGWGPCVKCGESARGRKKSSRAEAAFRIRLAELGAELLEPYHGAHEPHLVRCAAGHECHPRPSSVTSGRQGICRTCAGNDPAVTEAAFRARLAEAGATLLEPVWLGIARPHLRIPSDSVHPFRSNPYTDSGVFVHLARRLVVALA